MNEPERDVPLADLAGSQLALGMLEDGCTRSLPENARSLAHAMRGFSTGARTVLEFA